MRCAPQGTGCQQCSLQVTLPKKEVDDENEEMDTDEVSGIHKELAQLDFGRLNRQQRAAVSPPSAFDKMEEGFQKDIEERRAVLNRVAPNLKAVEQYEEAKASLLGSLVAYVPHQ